jgi:hypothetical protein
MSLTYNGVEYHTGTAGSLILCCARCGEEHFRDPLNYFGNPERHTCMTCRPKQQMVPIRMDELESKWKPLWRSLGILVKGDPGFPVDQA